MGMMCLTCRIEESGGGSSENLLKRVIHLGGFAETTRNPKQ